MYRSVLCLTTATPHTGAVGKSVWNNGNRNSDRDCALGERTSRKAQASKTADVRRCWTKTRLGRKHRPRSEQAGILQYTGIEGGLRAFA